MKERISEKVKIDVGIQAQSLNGAATGRYYDMKEYGKALAILTAGAIAATKTAKIELLQAKDVDGTDSKGIPTTAGQLATATITANALVTKATITLATFLAGGTITINGLVFTAHADTTTYANREFSISGNDTADAAELVKCINVATAGAYGVPGIKATSDAGVVTLVSEKPGEVVITISSNPDDGTCTKATVEAQAYVEVDTRQFDKNNDFNHVAAKVTTDAAIVVGAVLLRGDARDTPEQKVGASALV
jgi:hypothetical protein